MHASDQKLVSPKDIEELKTLKGQHVLIERWFAALPSAPAVLENDDQAERATSGLVVGNNVGVLKP